jgi:catalase
MVRSAYTLHGEDDDTSQARTLLNDVMDDAARDRFVDTVSGVLSAIRRQEILERSFAYWRSIDKAVGDRIEVLAREKRRAD